MKVIIFIILVGIVLWGGQGLSYRSELYWENVGPIMNKRLNPDK